MPEPAPAKLGEGPRNSQRGSAPEARAAGFAAGIRGTAEAHRAAPEPMTQQRPREAGADEAAHEAGRKAGASSVTASRRPGAYAGDAALGVMLRCIGWAPMGRCWSRGAPPRHAAAAAKGSAEAGACVGEPGRKRQGQCGDGREHQRSAAHRSSLLCQHGLDMGNRGRGGQGTDTGPRQRCLDIRNRSGPHGRQIGAATPAQHLSCSYRREWESLVALPRIQPLPAFCLTPTIQGEGPSSPVQLREDGRPAEFGRCGGSGRAWRTTMSTTVKIDSAPPVSSGTKDVWLARNVPFGRKGLGYSGRLQSRTVSAILRCSTLQSTVSCAARDLVSLRVEDIAAGGHVKERATIIQHKTGRPVQFEIMEQTRVSLQEWLNARQTNRGPHVFPSRVHNQPHLTARQYARIAHGWIEGAGMESSARHTLDAAHQGGADLTQNRKSQSGSATSRTRRLRGSCSSC